MKKGAAAPGSIASMMQAPAPKAAPRVAPRVAPPASTGRRGNLANLGTYAHPPKGKK